MAPWISILVVLSLSRGLLAGMNLCHRRWNPPPEVTRKLMHAGMGLILCACPLFFHRRWPVLLLCGVLIGLLQARRFVPFFQRQVCHVIYGVSRGSRGEFYFALAVAALCLLAGDRPMLFCVPMLVLALADPAAALAGTRYGLNRYRTPGGHKSVEGSAAFFVVAFLAVHVPLLLWGNLGPEASLLVAWDAAVVLTLLEAVAWDGLDNLFVPLGCFALLRVLPALDAEALRWASGGAAALLICCPALWSGLRAVRRAALAFVAAGCDGGRAGPRRGYRIAPSSAAASGPFPPRPGRHTSM